MKILANILVAACLVAVQTASAQAQEITENASPGVYTSPVEYVVPQGKCHPKCKNDDPGDPYTFQESTPYDLDPASGRILCTGAGCNFLGETKVTIDNKGRKATVTVHSRSIPVIIRFVANVQGGVLRPGTSGTAN